ncbi:Holliday junction branch migration protein RuvA [Vagococcus intermedius]|uniref:Holliday junction branch migration complex subunit RuvA n=1 Tax=Vagococcus intermedius TaxID=2991418 RepID=A0AAF0CV46_9ENTE|nr:Holliday junction branch migration protein RuvA [Vagococcus intermedius]WEG73436.1 Holliday junction branch migration protein RuvA [Vagococcus intermedius]WEG75519.1 Holliday junction branch migration protein RuvA [Vagococcus intermedius]
MYEYIKGIVTFVSPYYIVVETNNIGYQVAVANPFLYNLKEQKEVIIYLYQVVREDSLTLYGFTNLEEKQLFIKLISVSGIGPKSALAIMASEDHSGLVSAIESADSAFLTKFPGVGKKTAQQMILDLKGKLSDIVVTGLSGQDVLFSIEEMESSEGKYLEESLEALSALGYSERELKRISKELAKTQGQSTDDYLRQGLKLLMKK